MQKTSNLPRVAVLLSAYNGERWLHGQISSIENQDDVQLDIYVSIDLSTDGTLAFFEKASSVNPNIRILPYGARFGGAAPNFYRLISEVDFTGYDFVVFADQDDIWHPDKLQRACCILSSGWADVYSSNVIAFWEKGHEERIDKAQPQRKFDHFFEAAGPGCTYVFKQEVMLKLQEFVRVLPENTKKTILHDWLSYGFCREQGYRWYIDPNPSIRYRQHENNQIGTNNNWVAYKKRFFMIWNQDYRKQVELLVGTVAPEHLSDISSRLFLLKNFSQLRRRPRDRYFLLVLLLLGIY